MDGSFEVEPGDGGSRDQFLADNKVETFLIVGKVQKTVITESETGTTAASAANNKNSNGKKKSKVRMRNNFSKGVGRENVPRESINKAAYRKEEERLGKSLQLFPLWKRGKTFFFVPKQHLHVL